MPCAEHSGHRSVPHLPSRVPSGSTCYVGTLCPLLLSAPPSNPQSPRETKTLPGGLITTSEGCPEGSEGIPKGRFTQS